MSMALQVPHQEEAPQCLSFVMPLSLSIMSSGAILSEFPRFLKAERYSIISIYHILLICSLTLGLLFFSATVNNAAVSLVCKSLWGLGLLVIHPEVGLLGQTLMPYTQRWGVVGSDTNASHPEVGLLSQMLTLFSTVAVPFTFLPVVHKRPVSPHPCQDSVWLAICLSPIVAILMGVLRS